MPLGGPDVSKRVLDAFIRVLCGSSTRKILGVSRRMLGPTRRALGASSRVLGASRRVLGASRR